MPDQELIATIEQAFAEVRHPGRDDLTDSTYGAQPAALIAEFSGLTDWRTLNGGFLDHAPAGKGGALSFFTGPALRFYIPAYMIADIRGDLRSADPTFRLCRSVTPGGERTRIHEVWGGGTLGEYARAEFELFDAPQVAAIVDYLRWVLEKRGDDGDGEGRMVEQALENYWLPRAEELGLHV